MTSPYMPFDDLDFDDDDASMKRRDDDVLAEGGDDLRTERAGGTRMERGSDVWVERGDGEPVASRDSDVPAMTSSADLDPDASQDPRHVEPGPAIEFQQLVVPDGAHLGPTIGDGPDDLPPYTAQTPE